MRDWITGASRGQQEAALTELRAELVEFSHDGLVQLREDLKRHTVARGSWSGCVISYRRGASGSARRDRLGRARNAFTILWDNGWLTDEEVLHAADSEAARRAAGRVPEGVPA
jgi:hypothetical protein